jgi:cobalt/nickel transport system permease protein
MHFPHPLQLSQSVIGRLPSPVKAAGALILLVGIASLPLGEPALLAFPCAAVLLALVLSRMPPGYLLRRLLMLEPFALAASALVLFRGWGAFWTLLAKSSLSLTIVIVFSATTPFGDMLVLMRRLHLPRLLLTTIALLYRYLFVVADQAERMARARASRTFRAGKRRTWYLNSGVIGHLAIRSVERAERVYAAMRARGWE